MLIIAVGGKAVYKIYIREINVQNAINKMFASSAVLCCAFLRSFKFSSSYSLGQLMCKEKARTL